jgi:NitT/TauT family transport system permease protein
MTTRPLPLSDTARRNAAPAAPPLATPPVPSSALLPAPSGVGRPSTGRARRPGLSAALPATLSRVLLGLGPLILMVLLWQVLTANHVVFWLNFAKVPGPVEVFTEFRGQLTSGGYYQNLAASMRRILLGFGLATVTGVVIGVAIGRSRIASGALRPLIEVARPIPAIALVPLAILLFPSSEQGIVFITYFAAFFPVAVSTVHATKTLPNVWEEAAATMGAGRLSVLLNVVLPGALPGIFAGLSVAMGVAWICVISAEMISGQFGIGYYTWQAYGLLDYAGVVVGMLSIGALGFLTAWLVERIGARANRWLPKASQ